MESIKTAATLRMLIAEMEAGLGLASVSAAERNLLYAFLHAGCGPHRTVAISGIRNNPLIQDMPDPTLYRHVTKLVEKDLLLLAPGRRRGAYVVSRCRADEPE